MKLRNKTTREHGDYQVISAGNLIRVRDYASDESWEYNCLADFNDKWEDYAPVEPLIKDEKIREFVRAWAEVNGFNVLKYLEGSRRCELSYRLKNDDGDVVMELLGGIDGLENCKAYTIEELCGEENGE